MDSGQPTQQSTDGEPFAHHREHRQAESLPRTPQATRATNKKPSRSDA
jgi:hypothetical protein